MLAPHGLKPFWLGLAIAMVPAFIASASAQTKTAAKSADSGRPAFFVDWGGGTQPPPGLTSKPAPRKGSNPEYPADSVKRREEGTTAVQLCITADGRLADVHVTRSSGFTRLDAATVEWTRSAQFSPATVNGDAVNVCNYPLEYTWKLQG